MLLASPVLALATAASAQTLFSFDGTPGRLPKTVVPDAYQIAITPDLTTLSLTGEETIDVTVRQATTSITLNQAGLALTAAKLDGAPAAITEDQAAQTATLSFPGAISPGRHTLTIAYQGPIPETPNGIYYDDYKTADGATKRMLVTQFEVADARRMFPSWDEPAFKATFKLTATLPKGLAAVSNMPISSITPADGERQTIAFQTTPKMSSYLLALVVGDMAAVEGRAEGVYMRAFAPSGRESQARYALEAEEKILPYYNQYFATPYPLPKLDLIAIPGNYEAGAMENWGAITFIDDAMLFDPATSSGGTKEEIFEVVAHEMAHQWSGDLVTLGWWDNVWLNEGFATWMETKATDHLNPSWDIWPRQHGDRERAMAQDASPTTHPIQQVIHDESEANTAFDGISYQKGGQVIRMIEDWLGPDTFRDGMRLYMKRHAYGNATSADLWAALGEASGRDVASVASTFTEQAGVPLVNVSRSCSGGKGVLTLTQSRFTIHDANPQPETWLIPVALGGEDGKKQRLVLGASPTHVALASCDAPLKINAGENGYYRTQYDEASLKPLGKILPRLSAEDRANLLGDQFALFLSGSAPLEDYLNLVGALGSERNIAVWSDTINHLLSLERAVRGEPEHKAFEAYAIRILKPEFSRLGWDARPGESFLDGLLRPSLISALGIFEDPQIVGEAKRRFRAFLVKPAALAPALRQPVFQIVGRSADEATWSRLRDLAARAPGTEEKLRYFAAMAAATDPALIRKNVAFADAGEIPNGRITQFIQEVSSFSGKPDLVYSLFVPVEASIARRITSDGLGPTVLTAAAAGSADDATAAALLSAKSTMASDGAQIQAKRVAEGIRARAALRVRAAAALKAWLNAHSA